MSTNFEDLILRDTAANRPAAGKPGRLFYDTTNSKLQRDNGSDWDDCEPTASGDAGIPLDGWIDATAETWTYASADDPTFTFTIPGDKTGTYQAGQRLKLTQTTVKYFIITKVEYSAPNTTVTIYGGTDYDLANAAISANYYSPVKAPFGFPLSPDKWTVTFSDTSDRTQSNPSQNTWYNIGSLSFSVPIGVWLPSYSAVVYVDRSSGVLAGDFAISTANNSASNAAYVTANAVGNGVVAQWTVFLAAAPLTLTAKTTYYTILRTSQTGITTLILGGAIGTTTVRFVCAYL